MQIQPYLFFNGHCEEAFAFYREALGAELKGVMRYRDSPEPPASGLVPPDAGDKIMHGALRIGDSTVLASDGGCHGRPSFQGFALALTVANVAEAQQRFAALAEGGEVEMPLEKTFFSPCFGMLTDRFGMAWMVMAEAP